MSDAPSDSLNAPATEPYGIKPIQDWLALPAPTDPLQDLQPLRGHLLTMAEMPLTPQQRHQLLGQIYDRTTAAIGALLPTLCEAGMPLPRRVRSMVKSTQDLLDRLVQEQLATLDDPLEKYLVKGLCPQPAQTLWRCQHLLYRHLLISALAAAPAGVGIWERIHRTFVIAQERGLSLETPAGAPTSIVQEYGNALLLGCAQPASFTSDELIFIADITRRYGNLVEFTGATDEGHHGLFWIDPNRDASAVALNRRIPPPETQVSWFSCDRLAARLQDLLTKLELGRIPRQLGLPEFAATLAGKSVLRRLIRFWGAPARRRFNRRRQNYRATLCSGLEQLWRLLRAPDPSAIDTSNWMITNESPDGYALMHLSGPPGDLQVGDVVALRPERQEDQAAACSPLDWQVCLVRWALSENPEHLEIGLQILAPHALSATVVAPQRETNQHLAALLLPQIPNLRLVEALAVPAGSLRQNEGPLVLLTERDNLEVREVHTAALEEQTGSVEVFTIIPDTPPH